ncbi:MAG TPA: hypothetical protein VG897_19235, partial [Terriglobales bacterium]|nr:hypothetical protein [Terriglobales bacterium]
MSVDGNTLLVQLGFASIAAVGLFAALKPKSWMKIFLSDWQRDRMTSEGEMWIPIVGWTLFAFGTFLAAMIAIAGR